MDRKSLREEQFGSSQDLPESQINESLICGDPSVYIQQDETAQLGAAVKKGAIRRIEEDERRCNKLLWLAGLAALFLLLFGLHLLFGEGIMRVLKRLMARVSAAHSVPGYLVLASFQFLFAFVLFLPGLSTFNILQAFFLKSFWLSLLISCGGCYVASLAVCLLTRLCCRNRIHAKMKDMVIYKMLLKETSTKPYQTGIMFNFLFVPVSVKNYLIGISELRAAHCLVVFMPGHFPLCGLCAVIGSTVNDISDLFRSKGYSQKSRVEKLQFIFSLVLLVFTLAFFLTLFLVIKKKYKKFAEEEIREVQAGSAQAVRIHNKAENL